MHPKPFFDESLKGYIARISTLNGYESCSWVYQNSGLTQKDGKQMINVNKISPSTVSLEKLANLTLNVESELWALSYYDQFGDFEDHPFNETIINYLKKNALNTSRNAKYCPDCLKENEYFRKLWELTVYNVCHKHHCLMISKCPRCDRSVDLRIPPIGECKCGFEYKHSAQTYVSEEYSELERAIQSKVCPDENFNLTDNQLLKNDFRVFMYIVVDFTKLLVKVLEGDISNPLTNNYQITSFAYRAFTEWPKRFNLFIETYRAIYKERNNINSIGVREFGTLGIYLLNKYRELDGQLDFVIAEFENYLLEEWDGVLRGNAVNSIANKNKWTFLNDAARELNIGNRSLIKLIEEGKFNTRELTMGKRKYVAIPNDEIATYKEELNSEITYKEASEILNISTNNLIELSEAGLIEERNTHSQLTKINKSSVLSLLSKLEQKTKSFMESNESVLNLQETMKTFRSKGSSIVDLIKFIEKGDLCLFRKEDETKYGFKSFYFLENEIKLCLEIENYFNRTQLSEKLKVGHNVIAGWIEKGFLTGEKHWKEYRISKQVVTEFLKKYILLDEVSARTGLLSRVAKRHLIEKHINPISGHEIDEIRKYLFIREEVETFISAYLDYQSKNGLGNVEFFTIEELAEELKTNRHNLYQWIKGGFLKAHNNEEDKIRNKLWIPKSEVIQFKENYVMVKEISEMLGINHRFVKSILDQHNLEPVFGGDNNKSPKYLYVRKKIEEFIVCYNKNKIN